MTIVAGPPSDTRPLIAPVGSGRCRLSLSARMFWLFLLLAAFGVMILFIAVMAGYRSSELHSRYSKGCLLVSALEGALPGHQLNLNARRTLTNLGVHAINVVEHAGIRPLISLTPYTASADVVDVGSISLSSSVVGTLQTLFATENRTIRLFGAADDGSHQIEVVVDARRVRATMLERGGEALAVAMVLTLAGAFLSYWLVFLLVVRPLQKLADSVAAYQEKPTSTEFLIKPSGRRDELGTLEAQLLKMQLHVTEALHAQGRLVQLGLAVSKINHDLRNILAASRMFIDQLSRVNDPRVQKFAPKLQQSLERAIDLCQSTLIYGQAQEKPPVRRRVALHALIDDVWDIAGLRQTPLQKICWVNEALYADADPDHLFRVLMNIVRNAAQSLRDGAETYRATGAITFRGYRERSATVIDIEDNGPGIPDDMRQRIFEPFIHGQTGGAGLGLAIAVELIEGHGGRIDCLPNDGGAFFRITIPDST